LFVFIYFWSRTYKLYISITNKSKENTYKNKFYKLNHHSSSEYPPKSSEEGAGVTASGVDH
jgi:hypothetical protein